MSAYIEKDMPFKELTITCKDGKTHIIADGEELGHGTIGVYFSHDTEKNENEIRLHTRSRINLKQE